MINKEILARIILDFNKIKLPDIIVRDLKINLEIPIKRAIAILGPRRSGKTYYLYSLINKLQKKGIKRESILYVNFEDPKLVGARLEDLAALIDVFFEIYPENRNKKIWLFFDEIQNISQWEIFVRNILDKEKAQIFITGSSSKLLSKEIATSMRGRTLSYLILPFSFKEFLRAKNIKYKKYLSSGDKEKILNAFRKYFSSGGYPETILYPREKEKIIKEIIEVTIYRDLIERYGIRNIKIIRLMFNYLIKAKEFSTHQFYNFLKSMNIKVSKNTLYNYLELFSDAFIFFQLKKFSFSLKKIEQSMPKIYIIDNAFISEIISEDKGKKLENLVFLSLLRKGYKNNENIFYYVNGKEIDFLIKEKNKIKLLIQVCYDITDFATKKREVGALIKASEKLKCNNLLIITSDYENEEKIKNKKIKFIPLWKWMLE
ncbi:ATP-binding protein [Candidatus Falkowbacteria bacterium]|nr:MAG: ATP-binding protein [Candidatus Falkowbacteria bacterium]